MEFANPHALYSLLLLALPVLIHLLQFHRHKTIYFSSLSFLMQSTRQHQQRNRLKEWLLLFFRCLAFASIIFAFANPHIKQTAIQVGKPALLFIDNSPRMQYPAKSSNGTLFSAAQRRALELVASLPAGQKYILLTPKGVQTGALGSSQMKQTIRALTLSAYFPQRDNLYHQIASLRNEFSLEGTLDLFLIGGTLSSLLSPSSSADSLLVVYPISLEKRNVPNISLDTAWLSSPVTTVGSSLILSAKVSNHSDKELKEFPIKYFENDTLAGLAHATIPPHQSQEVSIPLLLRSAGNKHGYVHISDFPVVYDNSYYLSYRVQKHIRILWIHPPNDPAQSFLRPLLNYQDYRLHEENSLAIRYDQLQDKEVILVSGLPSLPIGLADELYKKLQQGTGVVLMPPINLSPNGYSSLLSKVGATLSPLPSPSPMAAKMPLSSHPFFHTVFFHHSPKEKYDMPTIQNRLALLTPSQNHAIITYEDGMPLFTKHAIGTGSLYSFALPFHKSNRTFFSHPLFSALLVRTILISSPKSLWGTTISHDAKLSLPAMNQATTQEVSVYSLEREVKFIPVVQQMAQETRLFIPNDVDKTGNYLVQIGDQSYPFSLNYQRQTLLSSAQKASPLDSRPNIRAIEETLQASTWTLWIVFLSIALLAILAEVALLRHFP